VTPTKSVTVSRRQFLAALGAGAASSALVAASLGAQDETGAQQNVSAMSNVAMDDSAYRPTRLAPKPGAKPLLTVAERDALEHQIQCMCPCTLDVFTCRTTDFSCGISPSMHRDVLALVEGGYSGDEIVKAFVGVYGEQVLMAPERKGFNLAGYLTPFAALGTGGVVVAYLIRKWGRERPVPVPVSTAPVVRGSTDELARLEAAIRNEDADR
jgi:cytochrome c-type biogenesis protein CcmH